MLDTGCLMLPRRGVVDAAAVASGLWRTGDGQIATHHHASLLRIDHHIPALQAGNVKMPPTATDMADLTARAADE